MGVIKVKLIIRNPFFPDKKIEGDFLVDTGAHYTVIPYSFVKKLGLKSSYRQKFILADGKTVSRSLSSALVNLEGRELAVPVVLGEKDDDSLLGITTLESFGLMIDPFKRRIYPSKLMLG